MREERIFSESHLLFARSFPLSRLELRVTRLVPRGARRGSCWWDDGDGLAERAANVLSKGPDTPICTDPRRRQRGVERGRFRIVLRRQRAEQGVRRDVEPACPTPTFRRTSSRADAPPGADIVILDSRPFDEYRRV